ncbi:pig-p domain containing protein [Grosmannia clavigera kw1407]|uniref:Pig-p domain containing protein n=1 Tax=Grosmannia clavigera (strain kw1407 / UAMH 11150) TaxID=655863 RepID=F0XAH8_GROCL|nr:pig-p domain containing protein [Grosmannia clavigera kw1407]EFX05541.1 pig-p domain containing protein [Grosmannia clavigera kw1407]
MLWPTMAASSEDDGKRAMESAVGTEGDYGETYDGGELDNAYDEEEYNDDAYNIYGALDGTGAEGGGSEDGEDSEDSGDVISGNSDEDEDGDGDGDEDEDEDENEDEDDETDGLDGDYSNRRQQRRQRSMRMSRPPVPQHNFAPPFYGRPPTPLPPSPSLTSLLRPSRPTTPDATDDELEPVPRAAPQVPTYEYYGFVLYLFSSMTFLMYLLWSYLPSPFLHGLGIYYYPNRWWSLAIPSFLAMSLAYTYVALASYNTEILTLPLSSIETIVDGAAKMAAVDDSGRVVVIGGPDGRRLQPKGVGVAGRGETSRRAVGDVAASSTQPTAFHYRQPSSPSPPPGGLAGWQDRQAGASGSNSSTRHSKNKAKTGRRDGGDKHGERRNGLMMGSGRQAWKRHQSDSHKAQGAGKPCRPDWNSLWSEGTDAVMDIPLAGVCEVLYA